MRLTEQQQSAVDTIDENLQIIACAGSGKTEVITRRIANILTSKTEVQPENIVAFTFTEKAAESMKTRIKKTLEEVGYEHSLEKMYIGTIHSFCHQILVQYSEKFRKFKILDTVKNHLFIARYASKCGLTDLELSISLYDIKVFVECIEKMVYDYEHRKEWEPKHLEAFEKYRACLFDHGYLDFSQLIFETIQQIYNEDAVKEYLSTVKYLVVDEYQDIDDLQEKMIYSFVKFGTNICVVGDDDQTIYQFRGSNADNMIGFSKRYPNVKQVRLEQNFRCGPGIVDVADCVIQNNQNRIFKKMVSMAETKEGSMIEAKGFDSKEEQYDAIGEKIQELHENGLKYSEIAVLVRKRKHIYYVSDALNLYNIPYETDNAKLFFESIYFKLFANTIKLLENMDKADLYTCWQDYANKTAFNQAFRDIRCMIRNNNNGYKLRLSDILGEFLNKIEFFNTDNENYQDREDDFEGFAQILNDFDEIYLDYSFSARISKFLKFLDDQAEEEYRFYNFKNHLDIDDCVHIMTVHKSKGLEFNTVFLPELEEKEFPSELTQRGRQYWHVLGGRFEENKTQFIGDIEDERKLFYVAVTRAKQNLFLTYDLSKKQISRFVEEALVSECMINKDEGKYKKSEKFEYEIQIKRSNTARDARKKLMDYYGTAMYAGMRMAGADLVRVQGLSDEEVIKEAQKIKLI